MSTNNSRSSWVNDVPSFIINASGSGDTVLVPAPGPQAFIRLLHYRLTADRPVTCKFYSGDSSTGTLKDVVYSTNASGGGISTPEHNSGLFACGLNQPLTLNLSVAAGVGGGGQYVTQGGTGG